MRILKTSWFDRFAKKRVISDSDLIAAIKRASEGLIDADLGGGLIKQRVAKKGEGRRGGFRTIIIYQRGERAFFVYGFAKSDRDNITEDELEGFKKLRDALNFSDGQLDAMIEKRKFIEIFTEASGDEEKL